MPEKREERTTEGGIDCIGQHNRLKPIVAALTDAGIRVSMFIEPDRKQIDAARVLGAPVVELHTGAYANAAGEARAKILKHIHNGAEFGADLGLEIHAGHGLTFDNVKPIAAIPHIRELNIGHFLIGEAIFTGLASIPNAALMDEARHEVPSSRRAACDAASGHPFLDLQGAISPKQGLMILGLGNDLIDIRRIEKTIAAHGERFLDRIYTDIERAKSDRRANRAATYAKRFAAKEACAKALGTGLNHGVYWRDMGVVNLPGGKPTMALTGGALKRLEKITPPGMRAQIDLTITDDFPLAQAIVIISAVPD